MDATVSSAPPAGAPPAPATAPPGTDLPREPLLLRSLGRVTRGLSALFWGLPVALVICAQCTRTDWLRAFGVVPPLVTTALLLYGIRELAGFRPQERIWRHALDRAQLLALVNVGLSPFLYWWSQSPLSLPFTAAVTLLAMSGLIFLANLNLVLLRLAAMLPDNVLRQETRLFTPWNRALLYGALFLLWAWLAVRARAEALPEAGLLALAYFEQFSLILVVVVVLVPLAMTMALLWKTKEVILDSVFGGD